jgi:hypothetical protein
MDRVARALMRSAPRTVTIVPDEASADLVVLHVIGYPETVEAVARCRARGQRYAMIQYCLMSTQEPHLWPWLNLWLGAAVVWSYYDLQTLWSVGIPNFYYAPLGVDDLFLRGFVKDGAPKYLVGCSGYVADAECLHEVVEAAKGLGFVFHLGHNLKLGDHVDWKLDIQDVDVLVAWADCQYVTGLRRVEGFELPVYEGLACGARPIVFDRPHYRHWLEDHAIYIPEASPADVTASLRAIFTGSPPTPVSRSEKLWLEDRFNWATIGRDFWERAL